MQELSLENLDTVSNNGAGQDSVDHNGPDGGQDPTQYGHGPDSIEFRAATSSASFFNWAALHPTAADNVAGILSSTTNDAMATQSLTNYFHSHGGDGWGFDPGDMGDIIVHGYHSTFGAMPTIDLYSVWFSGNLYAGAGDGHELGTRASDFTLIAATPDDIAQFQQALDYVHSSPQAEALFEVSGREGHQYLRHS